jgi:hypothetical protein
VLAAAITSHGHPRADQAKSSEHYPVAATSRT